MADKYDTWEKVKAASNMSAKLVHMMCEIKPKKTAPQEEQDGWDLNMNEVRKWCVSIHTRGIDLNMRELKAWRESQQ